ncbi:hypothetical protein [Streptosporangium minutum]|uniref:hypothetical protein n=1 Tax=Streptosporangium minutum TaxID=569862 RepID=UPI0010556A70|nr:hypothetical protein [Streptosporangium minutum]
MEGADTIQVLQRVIQEWLDVVESSNGANSVIFYGEVRLDAAKRLPFSGTAEVARPGALEQPSGGALSNSRS